MVIAYVSARHMSLGSVCAASSAILKMGGDVPHELRRARGIGLQMSLLRTRPSVSSHRNSWNYLMQPP